MPYITYVRKMDGRKNWTETSYIPLEYFQVQDENWIKRLEVIFDELYEKAVKILGLSLEKEYRTYFKKKKSGNGWRRIDIPSDRIKEYMREVDNFIKNESRYIFHDSAYGYVPKRNPLMMVKSHINGKRIITVDIKDFFPSCTLKYLQDIFHDIYPFCFLNKTKTDTVIKACSFSGSLPHGGPSSPTLSNIAMTPIDYKLNYKSFFNYTRYSDDIVISFHFLKDYPYVLTEIDEAFSRTPFKINRDKIKIDLCGDRTHILGLTLIKHRTKFISVKKGYVDIPGRITLGSKRKKELDALVYTFMMNCKNQVEIRREEALKIQGKVAFATSVEPEFMRKLIEKCERKIGFSFWPSLENAILTAR
jgi:hypothetical protein